MSDFDDALSDLHLDLFNEFGQPATVVRAGAGPVPVIVVLDREARQVGEYSEAVAMVDTVSFRTAEWAPRPGDVVTTSRGDRRIDAIDAEDGYVTTAVLHG